MVAVGVAVAAPGAVAVGNAVAVPVAVAVGVAVVVDVAVGDVEPADGRTSTILKLYRSPVGAVSLIVTLVLLSGVGPFWRCTQ
jgi:hypothetical protein